MHGSVPPAESPPTEGSPENGDPSATYSLADDLRSGAGTHHVAPPPEDATASALQPGASDQDAIERDGDHGCSARAATHDEADSMPNAAIRTRPGPNDALIRVDPSELKNDDIYEWEILIEAPFAFDFFKLVRSLVGVPEPLRRKDGEATSRKRYYARVALYNLGRIALIVGMIPFAMLAFSYVATLPFLLMRALAAWVGDRPVAVLAGVGLLVCLSVPVLIILSWFRPAAYRDSYKRSKVETINIVWALALFLASSMLEYLIASPALPVLRKDYTGSLGSTPQWTLFFADKAMNVLFANLPQKVFGPISDISIREGGSEVSLGLLRLLLIFGFVALVRLLALKLCASRKELFYGNVAELRKYLDYCGKAEARNIRKVIPIHDDEMIEIRTRARTADQANE